MGLPGVSIARPLVSQQASPPPRAVPPPPLPGKGGPELVLDSTQTPVDLKIDRSGDLVARTTLAGVMPVQVAVDPEAVLAGRYGSQMAIGLETPGKATLKGDLQVEGFPLPELVVPDPGLCQGFKELNFQLVADHFVQLGGTIKVGPFQLPFKADAQPVKVGNGLYDVTFSNVAIFGGIPLPTWFATWLARKVLSWTPCKAFSRPAPDRLTFDLRNAFNAEAPRGIDA